MAGEDRNDRKSIRILLEAFCPEMRGRIVEINDKVRLRDASPVNLKERVSSLARLVKARATRENTDVACVFFHEDLDQPDGDAYVTRRESVQAALLAKFNSAH